MNTTHDTDTQTANRVAETRAGISRGWRYTPLRLGKRPYLAGWPTRTDDPDTMLAYAERGNVGLITGAASGIDVIDLDDVAVERLAEFPETVTAITGGGGRHLYYLHDPDAAVKNWVGELGTHIDVRTTGGQVVAVGSIHASGQAYVWAPGLSPSETDFAPLPAGLIQQMYADEHPGATPPTATGSPASDGAVTNPAAPRKRATQTTTRRKTFVIAALDNETTVVANAHDGAGNAAINRAAFNLGQLVAAGELSDSEVVAALTSATAHWSARDGNDGAMRSTIQGTIRSGLQAGKRNPRPSSRMPSADTHRDHPLPTTDVGEELVEIPEGYEPREAMGAEDGYTPDVGAGDADGSEPFISDTAPDTAPAPSIPPVTRPAANAAFPLDPFAPAMRGEESRIGSWMDFGGATPRKRLVLSPDYTQPTARCYVDQFYSHPDRTRLVFQNGSFYEWRERENAWKETEQMHISAHVGRWLAEAITPHRSAKDKSSWRPFKSNPQTTGNALRTIQQETFLTKDILTPAWLGGEIPHPVEEVIPFKSSILHVPTREQIPPTPYLYVHNALEFDYIADAPKPTRWLQFLEEVFPEDPDQHATTQEWFGYCLTPDTRRHKMLMFLGPKRCGKGVMAYILQQLIGTSNICNPSIQDLAEKYGLEPFVGKLLAIFTDARWNSRDASDAMEKLLRITGGDSVTVRRMAMQSLSSVSLSARIMMLSNELPKFHDSSAAMVSRCLVVRSRQTFYGREDIDLKAKLRAELPGILLWALEGWKRLNAQKEFTVSQVMKEELSALEDLTSPVGKFVRARCEVGPDYDAGIKELYDAYAKWCKEEEHIEAVDRPWFFRNLNAAVSSVRRPTPHSTSYAGIKLTPF